MYLMLQHLGALLTLENQLTPTDSQQLASAHSFHMQTNQSRAHTTAIVFELRSPDPCPTALVTPGQGEDKQIHPVPQAPEIARPSQVNACLLCSLCSLPWEHNEESCPQFTLTPSDS